MIVCHCHAVTDREIRAAVDWMRAADPETIITPGKVWRTLGRRADCGGCMPLMLDCMSQCDTLEVPMNLRGLRRAAAATQGGSRDARRRQGHRLPERRAQE